VGSQIVRRLKTLGKHVITTSATEILGCDNITSSEDVLRLVCDSSISLAEAQVGLILSHRYREENIQAALGNELRITRDFVWSLSKLCASLRVVVLGSIAGRLVDRKMPESYHYSKDLQKSIVRQSVRIGSLYMNLIELNWFEKYTGHNATDEYSQIMLDLKQKLGGDNLPTVDSITDFACALIEMQRPPRGETIVYDGGLSLFQI